MTYTDKYFKILADLLEKIRTTQSDAIKKAAEMIVNASIAGKKIYIYGSTHAGILAQEAFYRTGGLAVINPVLPPGLTCDVVPITLTSALERQSEYGNIILAGLDIGDGDILILHSVSGRNGVAVEMAITAKRMGVNTICITNLEYSNASASRHESGKRLFEVCELVIDNCGVFGDASCEVDGFPGKVSPTSTVAGAAIINAICAEAASMYIKAEVEPPIFMSANIDGGDEYNKKIMKKYKDQIKYN